MLRNQQGGGEGEIGPKPALKVLPWSGPWLHLANSDAKEGQQQQRSSMPTGYFRDPWPTTLQDKTPGPDFQLPGFNILLLGSPGLQ